MAVTTFNDFPLASRDREWDGAAAEKRVGAWADDTARVTLLAAVTAFGILPYAEELLCCWRASPGLSPLPQPAEPATDTLRAPGQVSDLRQSRPSEAPASGN
jgi:hypothetical protein